MSQPLSDLPDDDRYRAQKCDGFLDLHMPGRARSEWEQLSPGARRHPIGQALELRLLMVEKNWTAARALAEQFHAGQPDDPSSWIQLAYATRRAEGLNAAEDILREARPRFPKEPVVVYNLACYACQAGRLDEARSLLAEAARLDPQSLAMAAEDDDLQALWPELG